MGDMWTQLVVTFRAVPWLLGSIPVAVITGLLVGHVARRSTRLTPAVGSGLIAASLIVIMVATLSPPFTGYLYGERTHPCSISSFRPTLSWWHPDSRALNVWLFAPLGVGVALQVKRWQVLAAALTLSPLIEILQHYLPFTLRVCDSQDVADNWLGLLIGFGVSAALVFLLSPHLKYVATQDPKVKPQPQAEPEFEPQGPNSPRV